MKTIASIAILLSFASTTLAQESVSADRLGSWLPRDANACDTIYGSGRELCLADRYQIQQFEKPRTNKFRCSTSRREPKVAQRTAARELARTPSQSGATPTSADFASIAALRVGTRRTAGLGRIGPALNTHSCTRRIYARNNRT